MPAETPCPEPCESDGRQAAAERAGNRKQRKQEGEVDVCRAEGIFDSIDAFETGGGRGEGGAVPLM